MLARKFNSDTRRKYIRYNCFCQTSLVISFWMSSLNIAFGCKSSWYIRSVRVITDAPTCRSTATFYIYIRSVSSWQLRQTSYFMRLLFEVQLHVSSIKLYIVTIIQLSIWIKRPYLKSRIALDSLWNSNFF